MSPEHTPHKIRPHIAELRDYNQVEAVKLPGHSPGARARQKIHDLCDEIEQPKDVKQSEQRISHRLQRFVLAQTSEHLPRKNREEKKQQDGDFEVVGTRRPHLAEI